MCVLFYISDSRSPDCLSRVTFCEDLSFVVLSLSLAFHSWTLRTCDLLRVAARSQANTVSRSFSLCQVVIRNHINADNYCKRGVSQCPDLRQAHCIASEYLWKERSATILHTGVSHCFDLWCCSIVTKEPTRQTRRGTCVREHERVSVAGLELLEERRA